MASWAVPRPTTAFALSLASGILVVFGALVLLLVGFSSVLALLAVVFGTIVLFAAILLYARPGEHAAWGVLILVFACLTIVGLGGFVAGMILGIIGGALAIAWRPERPVSAPWYGPPVPAYAPPASIVTASAYGIPRPYDVPGAYGIPIMQWRMCMGCGRTIPWASNVCPLCGTQAPVASWVPRTVEAPAAIAPPTAVYAPPPVAGPSAVARAAPPAVPPYGPPRPAPVKAPCPTCTGEAEWNPMQGRWFCPTESRFF